MGVQHQDGSHVLTSASVGLASIGSHTRSAEQGADSVRSNVPRDVWSALSARRSCDLTHARAARSCDLTHELYCTRVFG